MNGSEGFYSGAELKELTFAITAIEPFKPKWLEEPFFPEEIDSYRKLKDETNIPLATGEHLYTRWNVKPFLDENLISFV